MSTCGGNGCCFPPFLSCRSVVKVSCVNGQSEDVLSVTASVVSGAKFVAPAGTRAIPGANKTVNGFGWRTGSTNDETHPELCTGNVQPGTEHSDDKRDNVGFSSPTLVTRQHVKTGWNDMDCVMSFLTLSDEGSRSDDNPDLIKRKHRPDKITRTKTNKTTTADNLRFYHRVLLSLRQ